VKLLYARLLPRIIIGIYLSKALPMLRAPFAALLLAGVATPVLAENSRPQPIPFVNRIPEPRDVPYPGTIRLEVDATDLAHRIFNVRETLPVAKTGHMVLLFPQWLPGTHSPRGQLDKLAGLHIVANGKELPWTRDDVEVFAFHIEVPRGVKQLDIRLQFLSATVSDQGAIVMSPTLMRVQFNSMSLYPAGYFARRIPIAATVKYPEGWTAYSGLPAKAEGTTYSYETIDYENLVDSPTLAGKYCKSWPLSTRVFLDTCADDPKELAAKPEQIDAHKQLVEQAVRTFGSQHYDNYHLLFGLGDSIGGIGLEHHRSSENGRAKGYFTDWDNTVGDRNLLPHEYSHSWIGKYRRGEGNWTPNFNVPMRNELLWAYEGLDQFWGYVLQARSGLVSKQDTLDQYANIMATLDTRVARQWRDLVDTTNDPQISQRRPKGWLSWQRSEDYYNEGLLDWMEVDSILRRESRGTKSIDDFIRAFVGMNDGDWGTLTYSFDDIVRTLNGVQRYDWAAFWTRRLTETGAPAPLQGFIDNGYRLTYSDTPSATFKASEKTGTTNLGFSLGLVINKDAGITSVVWDSPAFKAGLTLGQTIVGVGGQVYSPEKLKEAITAAKSGNAPIKLMIKAGTELREVSIDYKDGLRYPHLEKIGKGESGLDLLLAPR